MTSENAARHQLDEPGRMTTRRRRIAAAVILTLLLLAITVAISPRAQTPAVAAFDEVHYRAWRLGGDCGINVPLMDRTKFDFLARLMGGTIVIETGPFIDELKVVPDSADASEASGVP
jgi:hypothetical protein